MTLTKSSPALLTLARATATATARGTTIGVTRRGFCDSTKSNKFATQCVMQDHLRSDAVQGLAPPICFASTYKLRDAAHGARLHSKEETPYVDEDGFVYTRWGNPTNEIAARTIAKIEGAKAGTVLFSSGMASITGALLSVLKAGDHVVFPYCVYGGTSELVHNYLTQFGIESSFVGVAVEEYEQALRPNTKVLYAESPANPTMRLTDLEKLGQLSLNQKITKEKTYVMVDNTFSTSYHIQVLAFQGIDVSIQSATKYLGGHSDILAGAVSSNDHDYMVKASRYQKIFGSLLDPMHSFLLSRGLKTLDVRMERHAKNAQAVAEFLEKHPAIERVYYPGLESHPDHQVALDQFRKGSGFGGMLSFIVKGGLESAKFMVENLNVINLAVSLGSVESLIEHPSSMTHTMIPKEQREAGGLYDGLVRLSVGIEDVDDLVGDLERSLDQVQNMNTVGSQAASA